MSQSNSQSDLSINKYIGLISVYDGSIFITCVSLQEINKILINYEKSTRSKYTLVFNLAIFSLSSLS